MSPLPQPTLAQPFPEINMGDLPNVLGLLLRLAQVRSYDRFFAEFEGQDARPSEMTVMWLVELNPGIRMGEVGRVLSIKPAHMTKMVQRLVTAGYLAREVPPDDRRAYCLSLTPAGQAHVDANRAAYDKVQSSQAAGLSEEEFNTLLFLLRKLAFEKVVSDAR